MRIIQIASNAVIGKVIEPKDMSAQEAKQFREVKLLISEWLSYIVEGHEHMKVRGWDGRSSFLNMRNGTFPAGFCSMIMTKLKNRGFECKWIKKPLPAPLGDENPKVDDFGDDPRYYYQPETIDKLLRYGHMISMVATGGGKSRICRMAYARIKRPTMFLTTRSVLMYQMKDDFEELIKQPVGVMGDGHWSPVDGMNVAMVQTLASRVEELTEAGVLESYLDAERNREVKEIDALKRRQSRSKTPFKERQLELQSLQQKHARARLSDVALENHIRIKLENHKKRREETLELLKTFELVILEEAHEAGGNSYYNVMNACINAHYRLALTATPFMRGDAESNMRLMACSGPIGIKITEKYLIDEGILATPKFYFVDTPKPEKLFRNTPWQRAYKYGIVENQARNQHIVNSCLKIKQFDLTSMILVQRKAHGDHLKQALTEKGLKAVFIHGEADQNERKRQLKKLENGQIDVLIGTTILDVGVDVPSVGAVILAGGGKAEVALRQRIGRGLRRKKTGPNICFVIDFVDRHNKTLYEHALTRHAIINKTPGFVENIMKKPLNPAEFGFKSKETLDV